MCSPFFFFLTQKEVILLFAFQEIIKSRTVDKIPPRDFMSRFQPLTARKAAILSCVPYKQVLALFFISSNSEERHIDAILYT